MKHKLTSAPDKSLDEYPRVNHLICHRRDVITEISFRTL